MLNITKKLIKSNYNYLVEIQDYFIILKKATGKRTFVSFHNMILLLSI